MSRSAPSRLYALLATILMVQGCDQGSSTHGNQTTAANPAQSGQTSDAAGEIYLSCELIDPQAERYRYYFAYNPDEGTFLWGDLEFEVVRNTSTELWSKYDEYQLRDFPHDATDFRLNRISGAAQITYLLKPTPSEISECEESLDPELHWACEGYTAISEHNQTGTCEVVDRAIE